MPVVVGDDDAELQRIVDMREDDGREAVFLAVVGDGFVEVDVGERVAADDEEGVVPEVLFGLLHAARRSERRIFHRIDDIDAPLGAIAEIAFDLIRQVVQRDYDVGDAVLLEQQHDMLHDRQY